MSPAGSRRNRMSWPRITVVTPSYNQGQFLEETIQSVLYQDYANLEYIVMDGGSTDGSAEIIHRYSDQLAYWVSRPDHGQTDALIQGFGRASGDVLCWLCADDVWESGTLREIGKIFATQPETRPFTGTRPSLTPKGGEFAFLRLSGFSVGSGSTRSTTFLNLLPSGDGICTSRWVASTPT